MGPGSGEAFTAVEAAVEGLTKEGPVGGEKHALKEDSAERTSGPVLLRARRVMPG